jgi:Protein of unknown function (DUF2530)
VGDQADLSQQTDAVVPVTVGTVLWAVALVVMIAFRPRLVAAGSQWWVWTCATGLGLGLFGCWWVRRRRAALRRAVVPDAAGADQPAD